jgi:predicted nucleic acid-binding protein
VIAYIDASVLLRFALGQSNALPQSGQIQHGVSSALITAESLRTLDALRIRANLPDSELASRRGAILQLLASLEIIEIDATVLNRAAQPLPTALGTLDAIHLATALLWRERMQTDPVMATHDRALAIAAQAHSPTWLLPPSAATPSHPAQKSTSSA